MSEPKHVSPRKAARMLNVHYNTVYSWCRDAIGGCPTKLHKVKQNTLTGRYMIDLAEIKKLQGSIL